MINTFTIKTCQTQVPEGVAVTGGQYALEFHAQAYALSCNYDRRIGELRASLSDECCRFVMVKDKRWDWIEALLQ